MRFMTVVLLIGVVVVLLSAVPMTTRALGQPEIVSVSPTSPQPVGTRVTVHIRVPWDNEFRSARICFRDRNWCQEEATTDFEKTFDTSGLSAGTYTIRVEAARWGDNDWSNTNNTETTYSLTGGTVIQPAPTQPPQVSCQVTAISVTPTSGAEGTTFTVSGGGSCNTGVRATRLWVDNWNFYELGAPEASSTWSSSGRGTGTHTARVQIAGWGDNDWQRAADSYLQFTVTGQSSPNPQVNSQPQTQTNTGSDCPSAVARLSPGNIARVSDYDPYSLRVRSQPGLGNTILFQIPIYEMFTIISGPRCVDGYRWYEVGYNGRSGWSAEVGPDGLYNMVPNGIAMPGPRDQNDQSSSSTSARFPNAQEYPNRGVHVSIICTAWGRGGTMPTPNNAWGWTCGDGQPVDFQQACRDAWGDTRPYATLTNWEDKYGWRCVSSPGYIDYPPVTEEEPIDPLLMLPPAGEVSGCMIPPVEPESTGWRFVTEAQARDLEGHPFSYGQCTDYVTQVYQQIVEECIPNSGADAYRWADLLGRRCGIAVSEVPEIGDIAVWRRSNITPLGHVAIVTAVHEDNSFDVAEYNVGEEWVRAALNERRLLEPHRRTVPVVTDGSVSFMRARQYVEGRAQTAAQIPESQNVCSQRSVIQRFVDWILRRTCVERS